MTTTHFIEPLDVLFLRGNKLFGDAGSFGESLVPPWPSVAAGAYRSALIANRKHDPVRYARGEIEDAELGRPDRPGSFSIAAFNLARRFANRIEPLFGLPADLVVIKEQGELAVRRPLPTACHSTIASSYPLPQVPVLAERERSKPESGYWLTAAGWRAYLNGETPTVDQLVDGRDLWKTDTRVGVGLDAATRRAAEGRLFTVQAVALHKAKHSFPEQGTDGYDVGFAARIAGVSLPEALTLRFGGDGRAALSKKAELNWPEPEYKDIARSGRCRLVLTSPGIFEQGWLPTGIERDSSGQIRFELHGVRGKLVAAAVPRLEVVSGWDLAKWQPKSARRATPASSVYWLEELEADEAALHKLAERGLWTDDAYDRDMRRVEGFNRFTFAAY